LTAELSRLAERQQVSDVLDDIEKPGASYAPQ
jgi:hypothetical protein